MKQRVVNVILITFVINYKNCSSYSLSAKRPCVDFYEFACSHYSLTHPDPQYNEMSQELDYILNRKLANYLQGILLRRTIFSMYYGQVYTYYHHMMDYFESCTQQQSSFYSEYLNVLKRSLEDLKKDEQVIFWPLLGLMQSYGFNNVIVDQQIIRNSNNSLSVILSVPRFKKDEPSLLENPALPAILKVLGFSDVVAAMQQLKATEWKWRELAQQYSDSELTFINSKLFCCNLGLQKYFENLLGDHLNNLSVVAVDNLKYFEFLNQKPWHTEELKQLCHYLVVKFLLYLEQDRTNEFEPLECVKDLRNKFDLGVNYLYYQEFFALEQTQLQLAFTVMISNIVVTVAKYFEENHLNLCGKQIMQLKNKLLAIKINMGNLPDNCNMDRVQTFYEGLTNLDRKNYHKNQLLLLKHGFHKSWSNQDHVKGADIGMASTPSTPYYLPGKNVIVIPFASLQMPLYHHSQTPLQQLSLLGFVVAHEITHAFDTIGLNYDAQGIRLSGESDIKTHANFSKAVNCLLQQEPTDFVHERIADLFGVRVAYRTYSEFYANGHKNWQKEFFENLAQFFCGKNNVQYRDHDSDRERLQQIVKNFEPFAQTYGCPEGSPMLAESKCRLY